VKFKIGIDHFTGRVEIRKWSSIGLKMDISSIFG